MGENGINHREKSLNGTKIIRLLRTFSAKEFKEVSHFLESFYATKHIELKTFACLKSFLEAEAPAVNEDLYLVDVFEQVYDRLPDEKKELTNLQNSISDLYGYLLRYLAWKEMDSPNFETEILKLRALKKRKLNEDYLSRIKRLSKRYEKQSDRDFWYPIRQLQLKDMHYYSTDIEKVDKAANVVSTAMSHLDDFYFNAKLKYGCEMISRKQFLQEENEIILLHEVVKELELREENGVLTNLYRNALKLLEDGKQKDFDELYSQVKGDLPISKNELYVFVGYLINYSAKLHRKGEVKGTKQSFELYKFGLKRNLFTLDTYFSDSIFLNIVLAGCILGTHLEVQYFIDKWAESLNPSLKEDTLGFSLIFLHSAKGEYEEAIGVCSRLNPKGSQPKIRLRIAEIKCYYELRVKYQKKFYSKCSQFENFMKEHKTLSENIVLSALNFIIMIKYILNQNDKEKLMEKLSSTTLIYSRGWLSEKINEM